MAKNLVLVPILAKIWACHYFFRMFYFYLWLGTVLSDHHVQFSGKLINQTSENREKLNFGPDFDSLGPNMPPLPKYHGQLSSCTMSEKANDPILKRLSDGQTDEKTDESIFIGRFRLMSSVQ